MKLEIKYIDPNKLIPYVNNAKTHSPEQIDLLAASIKEFGNVNPTLTDGKNGIIAGHGRTLAAIKLGLSEVPYIDLSHLSESQKKAYILADNRIGEIGTEWDMSLVNSELEALELDGFDIELTGFDLDLDGEEGEEPEEIDEGINFQEAYSIVITCKGSLEQEQLFNKLSGEGYDCKVLVN